MIHLEPPLFVVKVHAAGLAWWEDQGMPETQTIGCTTLESDLKWRHRQFAGDRRGRHYIYRLAEGLIIPTVEFDTYIDTHTSFESRVPPDPTKFWIDRREPALLEWFPDPAPLRKLALDLKGKVGAAGQ